MNKALKLGDFHDREHNRNLQALQKRLKTIGTTHERKKNNTDPLNNPVRLFRQSQSDYAKVSIEGYKHQVAVSNQKA